MFVHYYQSVEHNKWKRFKTKKNTNEISKNEVNSIIGTEKLYPRFPNVRWTRFINDCEGIDLSWTYFIDIRSWSTQRMGQRGNQKSLHPMIPNKRLQTKSDKQYNHKTSRSNTVAFGRIAFKYIPRDQKATKNHQNIRWWKPSVFHI